MYIDPGQGQTDPKGQNFDVNRKAGSKAVLLGVPRRYFCCGSLQLLVPRRYFLAFQGGTSVVVPYCYLFLMSVFILWFSYYVSDIFCKF